MTENTDRHSHRFVLTNACLALLRCFGTPKYDAQNLEHQSNQKLELAVIEALLSCHHSLWRECCKCRTEPFGRISKSFPLTKHWRLLRRQKILRLRNCAFIKKMSWYCFERQTKSAILIGNLHPHNPDSAGHYLVRLLSSLVCPDLYLRVKQSLSWSLNTFIELSQSTSENVAFSRPQLCC